MRLTSQKRDQIGIFTNSKNIHEHHGRVELDTIHEMIIAEKRSIQTNIIEFCLIESCLIFLFISLHIYNIVQQYVSLPFSVLILCLGPALSPHQELHFAWPSTTSRAAALHAVPAPDAVPVVATRLFNWENWDSSCGINCGFSDWCTIKSSIFSVMSGWPPLLGNLREFHQQGIVTGICCFLIPRCKTLMAWFRNVGGVSSCKGWYPLVI